MNPRTANLELIARFFDKYPELADKAFLSVKVTRPKHLLDSIATHDSRQGGSKADSMELDSSYVLCPHPEMERMAHF